MNNQLYQLAWKFRNALDQLKEAGELDNVLRFQWFPRGSCGDTCDLLAEYLWEQGIFTEYVCGTIGEQSHAWLVVADKETLEQKRVEQKREVVTIKEPDEIDDYENLEKLLQTASFSNTECVSPDYASELQGKTIIDITGDQFRDKKEFLFYDIPVYVGVMDEMHCLFKINYIHECTGLKDVGTFNRNRLCPLYEEIKKILSH